MKHFAKRTLAVVLAVMMLCTGLVIGVTAADTDVKLTLTSESSAKSITAALETNNIPEGKTIKSTEYTITPAEGNTMDVTAGKLFYNLTAGTTYTITVTVTLDDDTVFGTATETAAIAKESKAAPTGLKTTNITKSSVTVAVDDNTNVMYKITDKDGNAVGTYTDWTAESTFTGLTAGATYLITAKYAETDTHAESPVTEALTVVPMDKMGTPTTISIIPGAGSITVTASTSGNSSAVAEYSIDEGKNWVTDGTFTGLEEGKYYSLYIRNQATTTAYASDIVVRGATALQTNTDTAADPTFASVTKTSITFNAIDGYMYSIDGGQTWSSNAAFTGLTSGKDYFCEQYAGATATKAESKPSASVIVRTNTNDVYVASVNKLASCKLASDTNRANSDVSFTAYGDTRSSTESAQWGDTRYVAGAVTAEYNGTSVAGTVKANSDGTFTCTFKPTAKGTWTVHVTYVRQRYEQSQGWKDIDSYTKDFQVSVLTESNSTRDFFINVFNVLLNTIPSYLTKFVEWLEKIGLSILLFI